MDFSRGPYAFLRSGSKKGLVTTVAGAFFLSPSTVTSISRGWPVEAYAESTVAMQMYFLRRGDQQPLVARPTWRAPWYRGMFDRQATLGGSGGRSFSWKNRAAAFQSTSTPTIRRATPPRGP